MRTFSFNSISRYRGAIMGMEILLIMFFHFTEDCHSADMFFTGPIAAYYDYIRSSGVDVFLLVSGLGLYYSWKKSPDVVEFYHKRLVRILVPYLLVAIPFWGWKVLVFKDQPLTVFLQDLTFVTFFTKDRSTFWYIMMSLLCYILFPFLFSLLENARSPGRGLFRVAVLSGFLTVIAIVMRQDSPETYRIFDILLLRLPAFILGCWLGKMAWEKRTVRLWPVLVLVGGVFLLAGPLDGVDIPVLFRYVLAAVNYSLCILLILALELAGAHVPALQKAVLRFLGWFGTYSLELYILHVAIRNALNTLGHPTYLLHNELIVIAGALALTIPLHKLASLLQKRMPYTPAQG